MNFLFVGSTVYTYNKYGSLRISRDYVLTSLTMSQTATVGMKKSEFIFTVYPKKGAPNALAVDVLVISDLDK